ncbi:MAG: flagellar hook-associated protein FlgK [Mesorhizobium sp.]|nr:flagellar hook-associated protein FlgK [Mesorhizobium sp.]
MSLTTALSIAQQSLRSTSRQTATVSRNVTDANNPDYARRSAVVSSEAPGSRVITIQRASNNALFRANMSAISSYEGQATLRVGLNGLTQSVNGVDNAASPATAIGSLYQAMQLFATTPSNASLAENAVDAARQVVRALNDGTSAIQATRTDTDMQLSVAVDELNTLLADFEQTNNAVVFGTQAGRDVSDELDRRDSLLKKISEYLPISTFTRANQDMVITTSAGATLFETIPRAVSFEPKPGYAAGSTGNPVYVDGVPLTAGAGGSTTAGGKLSALLQLRDNVAPTMQAQLDEIARGLVNAFAETDPTGGALPALAGLFTWSGGPSLAPDGVVSAGLAGSIRINAAMDSTAGGDPRVLRDGGANGAAYVANTAGVASYSALLIGYSDRLDAPIAFDPSAGAGENASVMAYSTNAISWLENIRKQATTAEETKGALLTRTATALSNETGVNIDQEMSLLLELEHSYEASARIIKAVDEMLSTLLAAIR